MEKVGSGIIVRNIASKSPFNNIPVVKIIRQNLKFLKVKILYAFKVAQHDLA
jgi:hypothetical protein